MIALNDLPKHEVATERDDTSGWHYGTCYLQVNHPTGPLRYWWCSCRHCGTTALLNLGELKRGAQCQWCGYTVLTASNFRDFDWQADRLMRPWEVHQEVLSTAYRLGGVDAAMAIAAELHQRMKDNEAQLKAKGEALRKAWQP